MKKLLIAAVIMLCTQVTFAQFDFGLKGGINFNKIHTDEGNFGSNFRESLDSKTGFSAGVFARIGDKIFIQPEVLYTERNGKIIELNPLGNTTHNIKFKSVDIPVLVGFKLFKIIRVNAGPVANIKLSEKSGFFNTLGTATDKDAYQNATFGYQAGAGLSFGALDIDVRKDGSLGSISSKHFKDDKFNQRMDGWQLTLGLRIF